MIASASAENAHGIHITCEIAEIDKDTRPTLPKEATQKMSSPLAQYSSRIRRLVVC